MKLFVPYDFEYLRRHLEVVESSITRWLLDVEKTQETGFQGGNPISIVWLFKFSSSRRKEKTKRNKKKNLHLN